MPLDAAIGSPTYNSYLTVAAADALVPVLASVSRATAWDALEDPLKETLLVRAARLLDNYFDWEGRRVDDDQPIGWPRDFVYGLDRSTYHDSTSIPQRVQDAQALFALQLSEGFDAAANSGAPVDYVKVSSLSISFDNEKAGRGQTQVPADVIEVLRGYGEYVGTSGMARSVKVERV